MMDTASYLSKDDDDDIDDDGRPAVRFVDSIRDIDARHIAESCPLATWDDVDDDPPPLAVVIGDSAPNLEEIRPSLSRRWCFP